MQRVSNIYMHRNLTTYEPRHKIMDQSDASQSSYIQLDIETSELLWMMHKKNKISHLQSTNGRKKTELTFPGNPNITRKEGEVINKM